jgi:hypothetical protein
MSDGFQGVEESLAEKEIAEVRGQIAEVTSVFLCNLTSNL